MRRRVLVIDCEKRVVRESAVETLEDMQAIVGGLIQCALVLDNGDEIYVNEEGLLMDPQHFFNIRGAAGPFAMNGFVIGAADQDGEFTDCRSNIPFMENVTEFFTKSELLRLMGARP